MEKIILKYMIVIIPGGFVCGVEGNLNAVKFARENKIPCAGLFAMINDGQ